MSRGVEEHKSIVDTIGQEVVLDDARKDITTFPLMMKLRNTIWSLLNPLKLYGKETFVT